MREFELATARGEHLRQRLIACGAELATTVVSVEEMLRGRLAEISKLSVHPRRQIAAYAHFYAQDEVYARWLVLMWDAESANLFLNFRASGVRIGTMDLKIASITIAHGALLLTRNTVDFAQVPTLRFENWLD